MTCTSFTAGFSFALGQIVAGLLVVLGIVLVVAVGVFVAIQLRKE